MTASSAQPAAPTPAGAAARENPAHGTALLRLDHVSRHYGTLEAVDDVSFDMAPGELRAVIGPNGAGKTTFFNLIGFVPPTRGTVWFDGADITRQTAVRRVGRGIVRTFQITEMLPDLNVLDNIRMGVETAVASTRGRGSRARDARQSTRGSTS
jgi:branched-chain amino acid transport system ATP-binding protein